MEKTSIIAKNLLHFRVSEARTFSFKRASSYITLYLYLAILTLLLSISGCGYVTRSDLLRHINSITIPPVVNESDEYGLEEDLGTSIKQEFNRRWSDGADSLFSATIKYYKSGPHTWGSNGQPEEYRLIITMSFVFQDLKRNKIVRDEKNYERIHDFYVVEGLGKNPETQKEAKQKLITETAEDIVSSIVEEW